MSSNWYYALGDDEIGPIPAAELKSLAMDGTIRRATLVWKEGMADWKAASEIPGLLPAAEPKARQTAARSSAGQRPASRDPFADDHQDDDYGYYGSSDNPYEADGRTRSVRPPDGAGMVLALGIIALVSMPFMFIICPFLVIVISLPCGIAAWVTGNSYMTRSRNLGVDPEGTATAGRVCGIIAVVISALILVLVIGGIAFFALAV